MRKKHFCAKIQIIHRAGSFSKKGTHEKHPFIKIKVNIYSNQKYFPINLHQIKVSHIAIVMRTQNSFVKMCLLRNQIWIHCESFWVENFSFFFSSQGPFLCIRSETFDLIREWTTNRFARFTVAVAVAVADIYIDLHHLMANDSCLTKHPSRTYWNLFWNWIDCVCECVIPLYVKHEFIETECESWQRQ